MSDNDSQRKKKEAKEEKSCLLNDEIEENWRKEKKIIEQKRICSRFH